MKNLCSSESSSEWSKDIHQSRPNNKKPIPPPDHIRAQGIECKDTLSIPHKTIHRRNKHDRNGRPYGRNLIEKLGSKYFGVLFFAARLPFAYAAEFNSNSTNDLFSDLGPLLALFGEQVAKQFMTSSSVWEDNVLFAMGPLGIVTAVVSSIRVGGPLWLRALVGRARESRAAAEEELTTSTSHDVCEVWNGQSVVRLVGSPRILQIAYLADMNTSDPEDRILTLETETKSGCKFRKSAPNEYERSGVLVRRLMGLLVSSAAGIRSDLRTWRLIKKQNQPLSTDIVPPNLFLNLRPSLSLRQKWEIRAFTVLAVALQTFAVVFSGLITYHPRIKAQYKREGQDIESHAYPLAAAGTLILVLGMWICSFVIESSTVEHNWEVRQTSFSNPLTGPELSPAKSLRILWLQQGGAVTDQQFDSFAIIAKGDRTRIITSRLTSTLTENELLDSPAPEKHDHPLDEPDTIRHYYPCRTAKSGELDPSGGFQIITTIGTITSIGGFVIQFTGLRAMHYAATLSQLVVTVIMVVIRAWLRRGLSARPRAYKIPLGYEMDWLATRLAFEPEKLWSTYSDDHKECCLQLLTLPPLGGIKKGAIVERNDASSGECNCNVFDESCWKWGIASGHDSDCFEFCKLPLADTSDCHRAVKLRERIGQLSKWTGPVSEAAVALSTAIEVVMNILFKDARYEDMAWTIQGIQSSERANDTGLIYLSVRRPGGNWQSSATEIEAVLSLWLFSIRSKQARNLSDTSDDDWLRQGSNALRVSALRLLGPTENGSAYLRDLEWYAGDAYSEHVTAHSGSLRNRDQRLVFGFGKTEKEYTGKDRVSKIQGPKRSIKASFSRHSGYNLVSISEAPLEKHLMQDMFSSFMWAVARKMDRLAGKTTVLPKAQLDENYGDWQSFRLQNDQLTRLVNEILAVAGSWLGGTDEILLSMIPQLSENDKLPVPLEVIDYARVVSLPYEKSSNWRRAVSAYLFLYRCCGTLAIGSEMRKRVIAVVFDFCYTMSEVVSERQAFNADFDAIAESLDVEGQLLDALSSLASEGDDLVRKLLVLYRLQRRPLLKLEQRLASLGKYKADAPFNGFGGIGAFHESILGWNKRAREKPENDNLKWSHAEYNAQDELGLTPLHYFLLSLPSKHWNTGLLKLKDLIQHSTTLKKGEPVFDVDLVDISGWSVLHCAGVQGSALHKDASLLSEILQLNSSARDVKQGFAPDLSGRTPLFYVRSKSQARELVLYGGAAVRWVARDGSNALIAAARNGFDGVVEVFLEAGADPKSTDSLRRTAMHWSAYHGSAGLCKKMQKKGADANARDISERTPLHWTRASLSLNEELWKLFMDDADAVDLGGRTVLHLGAMTGTLHPNALKILEEPKRDSVNSKTKSRTSRYPRLVVNIEAKDQLGITALGQAAFRGHNDSIRLLLRYGAKLEMAEKFAKKPLQLAIVNGHATTVRLLLNCGASIEGPQPNSNMLPPEPLEVGPVTTAVLNEQLSLIRILLVRGVDLRGKDCRKALQNAVFRGDEAAAVLLLKWDVEIGSEFEHFDRRASGDRAWLLAEAAFRGMHETVRALLEKDIDIDCVYNGTRFIGNVSFTPKDPNWSDTTYEKGGTALYHASRGGREAVVRLLLDRGALVNLEDEGGRTALWKAVEKGDLRVIRLLLSRGATGLGSFRPESKDFKVLKIPTKELEELLRQGGIAFERYTDPGQV